MIDVQEHCAKLGRTIMKLWDDDPEVWDERVAEEGGEARGLERPLKPVLTSCRDLTTTSGGSSAATSAAITSLNLSTKDSRALSQAMCSLSWYSGFVIAVAMAAAASFSDS
jgi:hypothetical protein